MDAREVTTYVANLDKAIKGNLPPAHLVDLLTSLKTGVVATEKLLRETRVGMAVNKLRNHTDPKVSELTKEIVSKWKQDVQKSKPAAARAQGLARSTMSPMTSQRQATPPEPAGKRSESKSTVDPSLRNKKVDKVDCAVTGDKTRDNCVGILYDGLCVGSNADPNRILSLAKSLEEDVFKNHKRKIETQYKRRIQTLFLNLKDKNNPTLRKRVIDGEISTARLATMESKEMASEERKKENEALEAENMRESMVAKSERSISDQLQCGRCGQKKVSYTQAQTRSADEPMTTFCTCEVCGKLWKFS